jgi:hypothetical protein
MSALRAFNDIFKEHQLDKSSVVKESFTTDKDCQAASQAKSVNLKDIFQNDHYTEYFYSIH